MHAATVLAAVLAAAPAAAQLNRLAVLAGLKYFGTAVDNPALSDSAYMAIAKNPNEFGQITPANGQKWDATEPSQNVFTYTKGDAVTTVARTAGQLLRCHTLVWYNQLPTWVNGAGYSKAQMTSVIQNHVTNVVTHYKGQCYCWDVVNEAFEDNASYRTSPLYNALGKDFVPISFKQAAIADPAAKLYYNDYNIERPGAKANAALDLVKYIKSSGARIDGVGLQGHFIVGSTPSKDLLKQALALFLTEVSEVAYTELDIRHSRVPSSAADKNQQSTDYQTVVSACLETTGCVGVTVWDFADKYSWVPSTFSGAGEACLYDSSLKQKPAYTGLATLLQSVASVRLKAAASSSATATTTTTSSSSPTVVVTGSSSTPTSTVPSVSATPTSTATGSSTTTSSTSTTSTTTSTPRPSTSTSTSTSSTTTSTPRPLTPTTTSTSSTTTTTPRPSTPTSTSTSSTSTTTPRPSTPTSTTLSTVTSYETETVYETDIETIIETITEEPQVTEGPRVSKFGQCGGSNYNGPTLCVDGARCSTINPYYWQCA